MVPRGGIELSFIGLKFRYFSNVDFPVYPLMYPALRTLWQRDRSRSFTFDATKQSTAADLARKLND